MSEPRTFAAVIDGRTPVAVVYEDAQHVAFLAPEPLRAGHVIVATRRTADYLFDLSVSEQAALWDCVRVVAERLRARLPCARVCVSVVGWVVRHVHVHLVPTDAEGQMPALAGPPLPAAAALALAARLRGER